MGRCSYYWVVWTLLLSLRSTWCVSTGLAPYTYANTTNGPVSDDANSRRLTYVKLGVAVGMFAITATACTLPLLVMIFITRRLHFRTSGFVIASNVPHSGGTTPSYTSRQTDDQDQSSPTPLLDPPSNESEELLLTRGTDSQVPEMSRTTNHGVSSFYEVESQEDGSISRENQRRHWEEGTGATSESETLSGGTANEAIPPAVSIKTIRRRNSQRNRRLLRKWTSRINCFAAGVFLTTGLMDLFPEVQDAMAVALSALKINSQYPFPALFTLLGFFMVLSVEQGVHICHRRRHRYPSYVRPSYETPAANPHHLVHSHDHQIIPESDDGEGSSSTFRIILLLIALSVHSIFEGLAVGLQRSVSEVLTLFSALLLHKLIMATSIGVSLAAAHNQLRDGALRSQWMSAFFFSLASPIGVLVGWALITQRSSPALLMTIAVLQGLACGTFFFVVFCEMLPHEFSETESKPGSSMHDRLGKLFSLVLGFALIATYIVFAPE